MLNKESFTAAVMAWAEWLISQNLTPGSSYEPRVKDLTGKIIRQMLDFEGAFKAAALHQPHLAYELTFQPEVIATTMLFESFVGLIPKADFIEASNVVLPNLHRCLCHAALGHTPSVEPLRGDEVLNIKPPDKEEA